MSNTASTTRQITIPKSIAGICGLLLSAGLIYLGWAAFDYAHLKTSIPDVRYLNRAISDYQDTIEGQRQHIQKLADEINAIKTKLVSLNEFEEKIRIIANIKKTPEQKSLFGVGGTFSDDLETKIPLATDHSSLLRDMHEQVGQLELASNSQENGFDTLVNGLKHKQNLLASTPAIQPVNGWITSSFGYRTSPFTGKKVFHNAMDIANQAGTPVAAPANGIIAFVGQKRLLGNLIIIDHGYGIVTKYGHLQKILKKRGETVKRGDIIGLVGSTGRTTGPHLHYEVQLNGVPVNPKRYIIN